MKIKLLLLAAVALLSCTDDSAARSTLQKAGYTDVEVTGYDMMACSNDDTTSTGFRAKNANGQVVTGTVCCGLVFKSCTIRF